MSAGHQLINQSDARAEEMLARDDTVFAAREPLEFTTGKLSPAEVIASARIIVQHPDNASSVSVGAGFLDALLSMVLEMPLDELSALRAAENPALKAAA